MNRGTRTLRKDESYRYAFERMKQSISEGFPLEAICMVESIASDRLLSYAVGKGLVSGLPEKLVKLGLHQLIVIVSKSASTTKDHHTDNLMLSLDMWREERNQLVHSACKSFPGTATSRTPNQFDQDSRRVGQEGIELARQMVRWQQTKHRQVNSVSVLSPEAMQRRRENRRFWQKFIDTVRFDHADQPRPIHGLDNWVKIPLPAPIKWVTAYRTDEGCAQIGLFLGKSATRNAAFLRELARRAREIRSKTGLDLKPNRSFGIRREIQWDAPSTEPEQLAWLTEHANKYVNVLRPLLNEFVEGKRKNRIERSVSH
jgi:hypothetical protein